MLWITVAFIALCLAYPLWLMFLPTIKQSVKAGDYEIKGISLIMPCYNEAQKIRSKIQSLLKELACFKEFELIIIDNFSTDSTRDILTEFIDHPNVDRRIKKRTNGDPP